MKYRVHWYDHNEVIKTDPEPVIADNEVEGTRQAFIRYNGNPPAPVCYLEEIRE